MLYQVTARNQEGITGEVTLSSGKQIRTSHPLKDETGFNPEELLALSWSTCFHATLKTILQEQGQAQLDSRVDVTVSLEKEPEGVGYYFQVEATVAIAELSLTEVEAFATQAHGRCPVSKLLAPSPTVSVKVVPY